MPKITTREMLISYLTKAAEMEHGIICQYLFTAFTLKTHPREGHVTWPQLESIREWKSELLLMARQEMEHLGLVCNLLTGIGGLPYFQRPNFPNQVHYYPPYSEFQLERFCSSTIQRYARFEQLHNLRSDQSNGMLPIGV